MKTILVTAYAVHPEKGSEDGMGWHFIRQIARFHRVVAVTRPNNRPAIERYFRQHPDPDTEARLTMLYFDWPYWLRFWKRGPLLAMLYYYGWQLTLALWLRRKLRGPLAHLTVDLVHNLNFHNDWTPTFLHWLGKPLVWGPVGHHPPIPRPFLRPDYGWAAWGKDRLLWTMKRLFWRLDPFLAWGRRRAAHILCMNPSAAEALRLAPDRYSLMPSVASEAVEEPRTQPDEQPEGQSGAARSALFTVLSVGRFVALKGFPVTVRAFASFYRALPPSNQARVRLTLIGRGPDEARLRQLIREEGIEGCTELVAWLPRAELAARYRSAAAFLFPSFEGAGMVVAEAMSYGVPVLCWDTDGPGAFTPPASGLRVAPAPPEQATAYLARHLRRLHDDPLLLDHERQLARHHFAGAFDWQRRGEQLRQVYESVLATHA